ncbi:CLUMA_CG008857, isoform A [Clunio marinus]|uniref:CLUMA_CG008857, isoform A n=1 Tax=Clunio marinus TaxID=568069 RepID=A0A1J1IAG6_9DIPT|nr:CLUMA_CG008857, isoform A [Clunio marinus]
MNRMSIPYNAFRSVHLDFLRVLDNNCINESAETPHNINRFIVMADLLCSSLGEFEAFELYENETGKAQMNVPLRKLAVSVQLSNDTSQCYSHVHQYHISPNVQTKS